MPSSYPTAYDTFPAHATLMNQTPLHDDVHVHVEDALEAIEAELGLNPSGTSATVTARLAAIETTVASTGWVTYSPTVTFGGSTSQVTSTGAYAVGQSGMVDVFVQFSLAGTPTSGNIKFNLPFSVHASWRLLSTVAHEVVIGAASFIEGGVGWRRNMDVVVLSTDAANVGSVDVALGATASGPDLARHTAPFTWGIGDGGSMVLRFRQA